MAAETPEQVVHLLDDAFNRGDLEAILQLYDTAAFVHPIPGIEVRGIEQIRAMYQRVLQSGVTATQDTMRVLEADGVALFLSRWTLRSTGEAPQQFTSSVVLRKHPDAGWKVLIDLARGPDILNEP